MDIHIHKTKVEEIKKTFNKGLNTHGYSFQYAVIQAAKEACETGYSHWLFEASEFPVQANGKNTKIDFILKSSDKDHKYCIIAECKRVNPAYGRWCFIKSPFVSRYQSVDRFTIESLCRENHDDPLKVLVHGDTILERISYHIGFAVKDGNAIGEKYEKSDYDADCPPVFGPF